MNIIDDLKLQIAALTQQIKDVQDGCAHPKAATVCNPYKREGDPLGPAPTYHESCHCRLCDLHWDRPQVR